MIAPMSNSEKTFADNVRMMLLEQGLTQQELADRSKGGVSLRHVQRVLGLNGGVTLEKLDAIAKALNVEPWTLIMPGYEPKAVSDPRFKSLVDSWLSASSESRDYISRFTSNEAGKK